MRRKSTYKMVVLTMLICLEILLALTPLGYIPIGGIRATTLHLPVILSGVLFGYQSGAIVGLVFGLTSLILNTIQPTPFSFIFSPFYELGSIHGGMASVIIAIVPRVLIGVMAAFTFKTCKKYTFALPLSGILGSFTSTILVLLGIYVFFKEPYASVKNVSSDLVATILLSQLAINGVLEAIIAMISTSVIGNIGLRILKIK